MCAPIALTGLQLASSLAGAAAGRRDLARQARQAELDARAEAGLAAARAAFARDDALDRTAGLRARAFASGIDPQSESLVTALSAAHARSLDESRWFEHEGSHVLYRARNRAASLRAARQPMLARSLLGVAETLAGPSAGRYRL
jgi:hypothetical protein